MVHERELRSSRRRFLGAMVGVACACRLAVEASPRALAADGSVARLDEPGTALQTAERLALRPPPVPDGMLMFPVSPASDCYVLDNFGDARGSTRLHEGVDIMGSAGQPVVAVVSGVLTKRYTNTGTAGWGWSLYDASTKTTFKYYHLAEDSAGMVEGNSVTVGQPLGYVGNSGTSGENNFHLHFEVRPRNVAVDPLPLLVVDRKACRVSPPIRA
ncbi:MAG TPA: M23 family metallopeptidase [Ilumatobacteraceae bacterium]|nr:M23 family metallopeptidase [Ilumatobacteraceae bacterium]